MINMYFGSPGCGKTTTAVRNIIKNRDKGSYRRYYTNFDCEVATNISLENLGDWTLPSHSHLTIDESGIEYNNRKYKSLPQKTIEWFKLHRHYRVDVDLYSQSWEDTDITFRRLCDNYWNVRKLGPFTLVRRVRRFVDVDDETKQIKDGYEMCHLIDNLLPWRRNSFFFVPRWRYYRYFDSYSVPDDVPVKHDYPLYK